MAERLQEYVSSRGAALAVDREAGWIRGVKVLGLHSRNGRAYREAALSAGAGLYEGAKVNVNHARGATASARDYQDRIGALRGVRFVAGEGLFGDLQINPKHALAEQLFWDASHAPENVGLSHNVEARTSRDGATLVVEEILKVQSVDLVADPAATRGLFESRFSAEAEEHARLHAEVEQLREQCSELRRCRDQGAREALVRRCLAARGLPDPENGSPSARTLVGESFLREAREAPSDEAVRRLIAERAELVQASADWLARTRREPPRAREQRWRDDGGPLSGSGRIDAAEFARSLR